MELGQNGSFNQVAGSAVIDGYQPTIIEHFALKTLDESNITARTNSPNQPLEAALSSLFPEKHEETELLKARRIMGQEISNLSDEELRAALTQFQFLLTNWLDEFEKTVFDNKTLLQVLKEE